MKHTVTLVALVALFVMAGCSQDKQLADTAIKSAEQALTGMAADAQAYMPEQYTAAQDALAAAKQSFEQGHYKEALAAAQELTAMAPEMASTLATKKEEMSQAWADMSANMPAMMTAIQAEMDKVAKTKRYPSGMDAAKFQELTTMVGTLNQTWTDATNAFSAGNVAEAVNKGMMVHEGTTTCMNMLGMKQTP